MYGIGFGHKNSGQRFCYETLPALFIIQFVNRLSTVCFRVSTNFLPTLSAVGFYQISTRNIYFDDFSETAQLRRFLRFYPQKRQFYGNLVMLNDK